MKDQASETALPIVTAEELAGDPHRMLAEWRARSPVIALEDGRIIVLRSRDVAALTTDPRTIQVPGPVYADIHDLPQGRARHFVEHLLLFSNGEEHVRRRKPFARAFAFAAMRAERPAVREVARRVVSDLPRGGPVDFVSHVASRIPAEIIARLLGLPIGDAPRFSADVYMLARLFTTTYPRHLHGRIEAAACSLYAYLSEQIADRRRRPVADLMTALVPISDALGEEETVTQLMGVVLAGSDTTRTALAILVRNLLQDGQAWADLRADRGLIPGAVAESMRLEPSVGALPRVSVAPIEIGGVPVPPQRVLVLSTLSAMRDPEVYADPEIFDIRRADQPKLHPVFGGGVHRCLGEMLALIEQEEALDALLDGTPDLALVEPPEIFGFGGIRSVGPMMVDPG